MGTFSKKAVSVTLAATTTVWLSGAMMLFPVAQAQSTADLQAQINALLAQITALQAQLAAQTGGGTAVSCSFTRDLTVGSTGDDVKCLQQYLNASGNQVAASGVGSPGSETTYFGSLTQAAMAKWQAANGVSPAAGYFGPLSRSKYASLATGGTPSAPGAPAAPASGLAVSIASDTPTGSAISGAGQVATGRWNFTAGTAAGVTVSGLTFKKVGVLSDTNINNLYVADAGGVVLGQFSSLSSGVATFSGLSIAVNAGQTRKLELRMDVSSGASAGNTIAWTLDSVTVSGGGTVTGTPATSKDLTVTTVSNPSIATVTWNYNSVGSSVDAGTTNVLIGTASVSVSNSAVWLKSVKFTLVGSASMGDVRNLKLMVNGTQVGSTLAQANSDGSAVFDLSANPVKLVSGNSVVDLNADILGSPNRNLTVRTLRPYDLHVVDSQYNTGVSPTVTDDSNQITINQGAITVSLASDTPTGNIPVGASNVTLAKFTVYAAGEPVKVKFLTVQITAGGVTNWDTVAGVTDDIDNIQLVDDAGGQVGSTISTVAQGTTNGTCDVTGTANNLIQCFLGTSASPINYIIPANTTRVLSLKTSVLSGNDPTTLRGALLAMSSNLEGQISFQQASSGAANGAILTVTSNPLTVARNGSFANPVYVAGANGAKIASFVITASSAEGAKVNSLTIDKDSNAAFDIQNLKVMVGSTQFGSTRPTIADEETSLTFSGSSPITISAGQSATVDVFADILTSTTASGTAVIDIEGWTAVGLVSNSSIAFPTITSSMDGQDVVISSGPTLTVALDSSNPSSKYMVMGSADNAVAAFRLTSDNVEDIKVTDIQFLDTITSNGGNNRTSFKNMKLYDGATLVAGPLTPTIASSTTSTMTFSFGNSPVVVPKNGSKTLTVKGDLATFSEGAVSDSRHVWSVNSTSTVTAFGKDSNVAATVSGAPSGLSQHVYRTKLTFTSSLIGASSARARAAVDDLATVNWTANSGFQVLINSITVKFVGQAASNGSTAFSVDLLKSDNTAFGGSTETCTPLVANSCQVTFQPAFTITAGDTQATKVRVNSASFFNGAQTGDALSVLINAVGDVKFNDGTTVSITIETSTVPFTLGNTSYE